jgi:hypothetical protein
MKLLRSLHLYLGCIFAPILVFLTVSGIWQTFRLQDVPKGQPPSFLGMLSSIHTSSVSKLGTLSSSWMKGFIVLASASFLLTLILGIVMAFRYGRGRIVLLALLSGIALPLALVLLALKHG